MASTVRLTSVTPTVFFVREGAGLRQRVHVTLANDGAPCDAALCISGPDFDERLALGIVACGTSELAVTFPDIREVCGVTLGVEVDGTVTGAQEIPWTPQRHWEVYLVHYSHHDMGYTDLPSNVHKEYDGFLDQAIEYCEASAAWPDETARFRYQCEQAWSVVHYVEQRSPEMIERLVRCIKAGQIEVTALFGNQTLELCSHEELVRLLYPAFGLKRAWGIEIDSAKHNDIPGFTWGLASVLAGAGVRYFSPGVPVWYFGAAHPLWDTAQALPLDMPAACWWEGPDGERVLLWSDLHGQEWQPYNYEQAVTELPAMLAQLASGGYPYDMVSYTLRGGHRDNAPPTIRYAYLAQEWNRRWAYPKLINATNRSYLRAFERRWGDTLKTLRGDVPGTDYPAAASCTPRETAVDRAAHAWLMTAEKLATLAAWITGDAIPRVHLEQAYREVAYYDLHCWGFADVGGPAQDGHWAEKAVRAARAAALSHDTLVKAANRIADTISYEDDADYITVFNPHAYVCDQVVRAPLRAWAPCGTLMHWQHGDGEHAWPEYRAGGAIGRRIIHASTELQEGSFELVDVASGSRIAHQLSHVTDPQAAQPWAAERVALEGVDARVTRDLTFVAEGLPPMGYKTYRVVPAAQPIDAVTPAVEHESPLVLEDTHYRLEVDVRRGTLTQLFDKDLEHDFVDGGAPHGLGQVLIRTCDTAEETYVRFEEAAVVESGPLFTMVRLKGGGDCFPRVTVELALYHQVRRIELAYRILRDSTPLRESYIAFPFNVPAPTFRFDAPAAVIEPLRDQWPGSNTDYYAVQNWVDVCNAEMGVTWTPLDTPMAEFGGLWPGYVSAAHHGVTGPGYGHAFLGPDALTQGHIYALVSYNNFRTNFINVDAGEFLVRYALTTHAGTWEAARAWRFGWETMCAPATVWMRGPRQGVLPASGAFCSIDAPNVVALTLKAAEDGNGSVLRLFETQGRLTTTTVRLPSLELLHVVETNLVEENRRVLSASAHSFEVTLRPYGMATLRLTTKL